MGNPCATGVSHEVFSRAKGSFVDRLQAMQMVRHQPKERRRAAGALQC